MNEEARPGLWMALAHQFLDTEARHDLPRTALRCVEGGCTVDDVRAMWRFEVTPAVWPNLWSVVGEWAGWDAAWLEARIRATRTPAHRRGKLAYWIYRARVQGLHAVGVALEECVAVLRAADVATRGALAEDLAALARHYFDFWPEPFAPDRKDATRHLYERTFLAIFAPLAGSDNAAGEARVRRALAEDAASAR